MGAQQKRGAADKRELEGFDKGKEKAKFSREEEQTRVREPKRKA